MTKNFPRLLPSLVLQKSAFNLYLTLLGGLLLCITPAALSAQTVSYSGTAVNFGSVNICPTGQTTPAPCSETQTLTFTVTASGTLGPIQVLTLGAPDLDFTLSTGSTCTGSVTQGNTCTVNVQFAPQFAGLRRGGVEIVDSSGDVLADVPVYGIGSGPQITFQPGTISTVLRPTRTFDYMEGLAVDATGNVFVADGGNNAVKEVLAAGGYKTVKTLGSGFNSPTGVAVDGSGNVFVADTNNNAVKEILAAGGYTTIKNLGGVHSGLFIEPAGIAVDGSGNLFVSDLGDEEVTEILAAGGYSKVIVLQGEGITGSRAGVTVDGSGNVFFVNTTFSTVNEYLAAGGYGGYRSLGSGFKNPFDVAVDATGNVFVADTGNRKIKELLASGDYSTIRILPNSYPTLPAGLTVDQSGNIFASLYGVIKIDMTDPPSVTFPTPTGVGSIDATDGPQTFSVWNNGNQPLLFSATGSDPEYPQNFPENGADTSLCAAGVPLAAGQSCDVSINFQPSFAGVNTGEVVFTDNVLNSSAATQSISLSGQGGSVIPTSSLDLNFGTIPLGTNSVLSVTLKNDGAAATVTTANEGPSTFSYKVLTVGNTCASGVAAGESCTLPIEFAPTSSGVHSAHILVTPSVGPSFAINAIGTGTEP